MFSTDLINFIVALVVLLVLAWFINTRAIVEGRMRTVVNLVFGLIIVGIFLWIVNTYIPMAKSIKTILNIVVVIATCVRVLQVFGLWESVVAMWRNLTRSLHPSTHDGPRIVP
jgi:undecaprenyl pyrophosphate phosphatase UppP